MKNSIVAPLRRFAASSPISIALAALLVLGGSVAMAAGLVTGSTGQVSPTAIPITKPATTMTWMIMVSGMMYPTGDVSAGGNGAMTEDAYIGEVRLFASADTYLTNNSSVWFPCDGRTMQITSYQALYSLLGTLFGGDGVTTFKLPDMRGRTPIGVGTGTGLTSRTVGQIGGGETVTPATANLPAHTHTIAGGNNTDSSGSGTGLNNMPPFIVLSPAIVGMGNDSTSIGTIRWFAFPDVLPWSPANRHLPGLPCDGAIKAISQHFALFSKIGSTFGGNGTTNFAVPDLRGRMAIGAGSGPGLTARPLGQSGGSETYTLTATDMPAHTHSYTGGTTGSAGGAGAAHNVMAPFLVLNTGLAVGGTYGESDYDPAIGEVRFFAKSSSLLAIDGDNTGYGWLPCDGTVQAYTNAVNGGNILIAYFSIVGSTWGGDGGTTVGVPDLRGRSTLSFGQGAGLTNRVLAAQFGSESLPALTSASLPAHTHTEPTVGTTVTSLNRVNATPSNATTVNWTLTFSAAVTGVTASNFSLSGTAATGASVGTPTIASGGGLTWNVPVTTGSTDGTLALSLANATGLTPALSTALPFATAGQDYTMDKTAPTIGIGSPSVGSVNAGQGSVTYTVTYADTNFNASTLANGNITLNATGGASGTVNVTGSGTTRTVTISSITGAGTLGISIASGTASDTAGNTAPAAGPSTTFTVIGVPGAPTIGTATAGNASASVAFTAPAITGGSAILDYTVTSNPGTITATGSNSPITVSGLTNGTAYTFTVTARNAIGPGAASAPSNSVTPAAPADIPITIGVGSTLTIDATGSAGAAETTVRLVDLGGGVFVLEITDPNRSIGAPPGGTQVNSKAVQIPIGLVGNLVINGTSSGDQFTLDLSMGTLPGQITVNGNLPTSSPGDSLRVIGAYDDITYGPNGVGSGNLDVDGTQVAFSGFEPLDFSGASIGNLTVTVDPTSTFAGDVITTIASVDAGVNTEITFADNAGVANGLESIKIGALTGTLTIEGDNADNDFFKLQGLGSAMVGHLSIDGKGGASDIVVINGTTVTMAGAGKNFTATADFIATGRVSVASPADNPGILECSGNIMLVADGDSTVTSPSLFGAGGVWSGVPITPVASAYLGTSVTGVAYSRGSILHRGVVRKTAGADATVTFKAKANVTFQNATPGAGTVTSTSNKLHTVLWSDSDNSGEGNIACGAISSITTNGGNVTMGGGTDPALNPARGLTGAVVGVVVSATSINTEGGNLSIRGLGGNVANGLGVAFTANNVLNPTATTSTGAGSITIVGTGGNTTSGVQIQGDTAGVTATTQLLTTTGAISITGTAGGGISSGVSMTSLTNVSSSGAGNITITGTGAGGGLGCLLAPASTRTATVSSTGGAITLIADTMNLDGGAGTESITTGSSTSGSVTLKPLTAGKQIALGSGVTDSGTQLAIDSSIELTNVTAGTVTIGDSASGPIFVSSVISPATFTTLGLASGISSTFQSTAGFIADVTSASNYEKIAVTGGIVITLNATFTASSAGGYVWNGTDAFTFINNDGSDAISGSTFTGPTLTNFLGSTLTATQSYTGGTGNDLVIGAAPPIVTNVFPPSGPTTGGTSITITGSNLLGATSVTVGGTPATNVLVVNSGSITCDTPAGSAGPANVLVTTQAGTSAPSSTFTYVAPPTITTVAPSSGTTAGGTVVMISGTGFTGASAVTFDGIAASSFTVTSDTQIMTTTPAHAAGAVNVVVTTLGGTNSANALYTYMVINTAPTISSNGGGATASIDVIENTTAVTTVIASDTDLPAQTITYSKSGTHAALFNLSSGGVLTFVTAPDFETNPGPFSVTVTATDNGSPNLSDSQDLTINVLNANETPPAGTDKAITMNEGTTYTFVPADFGFTDPLSSPADNFKTLHIASLPTAGSLLVGGVPAVVGDTVTPSTAQAGATLVERTSSVPSGDTPGFSTILSSGNGMKLIAKSNNGYMRFSSDGGASWVTRNTLFMSGEVWAMTRDGSKLIVKASTGYLSVSTDDGQTWTQLTSAGSRDWQQVVISANGQRIAAAEGNGYIHTSTNGGSSWTQQTGSGPTYYWLSLVASDDGMRLAAGRFSSSSQNQLLLTSTDGGVTWTEQPNSGVRDWRRLACSADGLKLVTAGYSPISRVFTSSDGGANWTERTSSSNTVNWTGVASSSDGMRLFALGSQLLETSSDGGATWTTKSLNTAPLNIFSANSIAASSDGSRLAIADYFPMTGKIWTSVGASSTTPTLTYTAPSVPADASPLTSFTFQVEDDGSTANGGQVLDLSPNTISINVLNLNAAPTDITLTPSSIAENNAANATVGTLAAVDADAGQTHTFTKVTGTGDTDNASFSISGTDLILIPSANFEVKSSYSVRVQADDGNGGTFAKALTVTITDVNEAPSIVNFGSLPTFPLDWAEAAPGSLTYAASDPDAGQTLTYSKSGADEALFDLTPAGVLTFVTPRDFENPTDANTDGVYEVTITVTDNGAVPLSDSQALVITVTNRNEPPTFTGGSSPVHTVDSGAKTVPGWATAMDDGDSTVTQALSFTVVQSGGAAIFSTPPTIAADGTLSYTLNGSIGTATLYAYLTDDNAITPHAALNSFPSYFFSITNQTLPDYQVTYSGGALTVTDLSGISGTVLYLYEKTGEAGRVRFYDAGRTFSVNGGLKSTTETSVSFLMADLTSSVTINAGAGNNTIRVETNIPGNVLTLPSLTINGGAGNDTVQIRNSITFLAGASLDVDLQNDAGGAGLDTVTISNNVLMPLLGTGSATIKCSGPISLGSSTQLTTVNGNLTLEANQQAVPSVSSFSGITLGGSALVQASGTGQVTVKGRTGDTSGQHGVVMAGGASIMGGTTGTLNVSAVSNAATAGGSGHGLMMFAPAAMISTTGANVVVEGTAAVSGSGVFVDGGVISAGGAGTVSVTGTGGVGGAFSSYGVLVRRSSGTQNGSILSSGGNVTVVGNGGSGTNGGNYGVLIQGPADIRPGTNGNLSITGTCSATATTGSGSAGVFTTNTGVTVGVSGTGTLVVNGTGGNVSGGFNSGVVLSSGTSVTLGSGNVTIMGTAGPGGGSNNQGVSIVVPLTSSGGNLSITGTGKGVATTNGNHGVTTNVLSTTGTGTITVQGMAATTAGGYGFQPSGAITTAGGSISLTGVGGGAGTDGTGRGVLINNVAVSGPAAGSTLTLHGTGSTLTGAGNFAVGVELAGSGAQVSTTGGDIVVTGIGGADSSLYSMGIVLNGGSVAAGGAGKINLIGSGGANLGVTHGVWLIGGSVSTNNGDITLTGTAGGQPASPPNYGISSAVNVIAGGTGTITLVADSMNLSGAFQAVGDTITARPRTAATPILIGGADVLTGSLALGLSDGELDRFDCATVTIGESTSGPIAVSADISPATYKTFVLKNNTDFTNTGRFFSDVGATASVFEKISVEGTVTLNTNANVFFSSTGGYVPALGDSFKIIDNDGSDAVSGTFTGKAEGAVLANFAGSSLNARITYLGGDGNDVVVTVQNIAPVITSNGGGTTASITVAENTTAVTTVTYTDPDVPQTKTYSLSGTDAALFSITSGGVLTFIAPPDFEGAHGNTYAVTVTVTDDGSPILSDSQDLTITVTNANEVPSFTKGGDQVHPYQTSGAQSVTAWATGMDDGDSTVVQALTFNVSNNNNALFTTQPALDASTGTLTYTLNGTSGIATVSVSLTDDNTINGNLARTSAVQTFTITVEMPDYLVTTNATTVTVTNLSNTSDTLSFTDGGAFATFAAAGRTFSLNGALTQSGSLDLTYASLPGITTIIIDGAGGSDTINIGDFSARSGFPGLTIHGGTGDDTVNFNGDITFATDASLDADLQNDDPAPGIDTVNVATNANILTSGTGTITVKVSKSFAMASGSSFETVNGGITVEANQQATPASGTFIGVLVSNAQVKSTGSGTVSVLGKGGDSGTNQYGVSVAAAGSITGGTSGTTTVVGRAGASTGAFAKGVLIDGSGSKITANGADIAVQGFGGTSSTGSNSKGVHLINAGSIVAVSTGTITVSGTAGTGTNQCTGVELLSGTLIASAGGQVQVSGQGGGTGAATTSRGVVVSGTISAAGTGAVEVTGTGGVGTGGNNNGILLEQNNANGTIQEIKSANGNVTVTGTPGSGANSEAIKLNSVALAPASVMTASPGVLTLIGDSINLVSSSAISNTGGTVKLLQKTAGTVIALGGADSSGTLGLTDAELDCVTADILIVGDSNSGNLVVQSAVSPAGAAAMNLISGGTISDTNTSGTDITIASLTTTGNLVSVGSTPGIFTVTGNHAFAASSYFSITLGGTTPGTQHGQLSATGSVNLGASTTLALGASGGFTPSIGQVFTIISRTGGTGTFFGLAEGASVSSNFLGSGLPARISYVGGDGDDVIIRVANPEMIVTGKSIEIVDGDTTPVAADNTDFGGILVIGSPVPHVFRIANTGTSALSLTGTPKIVLSDTVNFSVGLDPVSPVAVAGNTLFQIIFDPVSAGVKTCTVSIANDDSDENPYNFVITGEGTVPEPVEFTVGGVPRNVVTNEVATDAAGLGDGTQFDILGRGGYLANNGVLGVPGTLKIGVGGVTEVPNNFQGYWKSNGSTLSRLIRSGDVAPGTGGALFNAIPTIPVPGLNPDGEVTLLTALRVGTGSPAVTTSDDQGMWSEVGGNGLQLLMRENDAVPGIAGAFVANFGYGCYATATTGAGAGEAAFTVKLKGSTTDSVLLRMSITGPGTADVSVVAREKTAAPGTAEQFGALHSTFTSAVRMDPQGNIVFGAVTRPSNKTGIWSQALGGALAKVFVAGDVAPDTGGATFAALDMPSMAADGAFTFRGVLNRDGDNTANDKNDGIWFRSDTGFIFPILRRGDATVTGLPVGGKVGNVWNGWVNLGGEGAWRGWVDTAGDGISPFPADTYGIYTNMGSDMELLISVGDTAPGVAGATFSFMDHPVVGGDSSLDGYLAFLGNITGGGINGSNNKGVWASHNGNAPILVLRTGDEMPTSQGSKVVSNIDLPGSGMDIRPWQQSVIDNQGRILLFITYTDGTTAQVVIPVFSPSTAD
ncbi:MAG: tail fiber protein [Verrucomicrobiaceae bacterium]|nr:tail fiber protein [Verrucomicrobiaceae bacterium]